MKKIIVIFCFVAIGCASTDSNQQQYPQYEPVPSVIQGSKDATYWQSLVKVPPNYPSSAMSRGLQGCVKIGFTITPDGTTANPFVIKSFPNSIWDRAGIEAALKFKYAPSPTNVNREPVISSNTFTFNHSSGRAFSFEELFMKCE